MESLINSLGRFVRRDLLYIIGGVSVVLSFLYLFDKLSLGTITSFEIILILSIGYVTGIVSQESIVLTRIIMVRYPYPEKIGKFKKKLYTRFTYRHWDIVKFDYNKHKEKVLDSLSDLNNDRLERIIFLKHIGATIGSNFIFSSIILVFKTIQNPDAFNIVLSSTLIVITFLLLLINWIKSLQEIVFVYQTAGKPQDNYQLEK